MNVLIVTAHPASYGFAHKIASRYQQVSQERGDEVLIMDLYKKKYAQPFLRYENIKTDVKPTAATRAIQKQLVWADEIVFAFPIWWFGPPAILKNFLDVNFTSGFAYKYNTQGVRAELLEGRTARIFATSDGPSWVYFLFQWTALMRWRHGVLGFCGIELKTFDVFPRMIRRRSDDERERMLRRIAERARQYDAPRTQKRIPPGM